MHYHFATRETSLLRIAWHCARACACALSALQVWLCSLALLAAHTLLAHVFLFWHHGTGKATKDKM